MTYVVGSALDVLCDRIKQSALRGDTDALADLRASTPRYLITEALGYMGEDDDHDNDAAAFAHVVALLTDEQ